MRPSIPSGLSTKLMIGRDLTSLSRTTAKWPENWSAVLRLPTGAVGASAWPALGDRRVTSWKASRPVVGEVEGDVRLVEFGRVPASGR